MKVAFLLALLTLPAYGEADGGAADGPKIVRLTDDEYLVNTAAFSKIDTEVKRLQVVEAQHKGESWSSVLLIGAGLGLVLGLGLGFAVGRATAPKS